MTRDEAKQALIDGNKVTHDNYTSDEWLALDNGVLVTEDGYAKGTFSGEFWNKYQNWPDGWNIYKEIINH